MPRLTQTTTGNDIFNMLNNFLETEDLKWSNCVGVCTDGAASMTGDKKGLKAKIKEVAPHVCFTYCIIHREVLATKNLDVEAKTVLQEAIKVVNFVKSRPLNARLFSVLCKEMQSDHDSLLIHTEVRWLSKGKVLQHLVELKHEVGIFLENANSELARHFTDSRWLAILSFLADIFHKLNDLNTSLQGPNTNIFQLNNKITGFIKKITLWKTHCENDNIAMFENLNAFLNDNELHFHEVKLLVITHLTNLKVHFGKYFDDLSLSKHEWIRSPFNDIETISHLSISQQEKLLELSSDGTLKRKFDIVPLAEFWILVKNEYPQLSELAMSILIPFTSTYLCEKAFSSMVTIKTKSRNRLQVEGDLRLSLSPIQPRMDLLCSNVQSHPSH